tara:strand:- start:437 stop:718 length:282 start_codon:yes stop_codon:yes gene_type:complete
MLDKVIKKLSIILTLCGGIAILLYTTDLGAIFNGEVKKKVEEFKEETKEKIEAKKEEVQKKVDKVEAKIESNVEKVEEKIDDLKKLKLKDLVK